MKEEEDTAKEALDGGALAEFLFSPGGWQAGAVLLALGIPGDGRDCMEGRMDLGDEAQAPISGVQTDDARADGVEAHGPFQQWLRERGIMDIGRRKQIEDR